MRRKHLQCRSENASGDTRCTPTSYKWARWLFFLQAEQYHLKIIQLRQSSLGPDHLETLQAVAWPKKDVGDKGADSCGFIVFPMDWRMVWPKKLDLLSLSAC